MLNDAPGGGSAFINSIGKVQITATEFAAKFQSKREVYRFLSSDVKAYLPNYEAVTVWHLRDLASGKKKLIKNEDANHFTVPQFEGLTITTMMEFAKLYPEVHNALPSEQGELDKIGREYLANVIFSLV